MVIETDRLIEAIRDLGLVEPDRFTELGALAERNPNLRDLGRLLIQQEWLTAYQVNQLLQGRGKQLLLGPYVLLERIATGGMGEVFKARHRRLQRIAAVKVVNRARRDHPNALQRFRREAEVAAQLSHPNIVAVHDFGEEEETLYLAMEFIDGIDLARLVVQSGPLPVALASDFIRQAAIGLHHAHEQGFVHRDIKPQNLLVSPRVRPREIEQPASKGPVSFSRYVGATVKILDMGLIRLQDEVETNALALTQNGVVIGTMDYLAPEQALNSHQVDRRADLYSLGCTAYHLLTGQPPFPGGMPLDKLLRHQTDQPASVRQIRPDVPAELEAILQKMLAKRPDDRPATAVDVALALVPFASKAPATAVVRKVPAPPGGAAATRRVPIPAGDFSGLAPTRIIDPRGAESETSVPGHPTPPAVTRRIRLEKPPPPTRKTRWWRVTAGVVVLLLVCAFAAFVPRPASPPPVPPVKKEVDRLRDYVPAETAAVLQVQPRPFLGAAIFRRDSKAARRPDLDPGALKLLDALGVDAERDVDQIRFCFPSGAVEQSLWILQGRFDPARWSKVGKPDGRAGLYTYRPPAGKPIYLGQHRAYLLASQQRQEVVSGLDQAKTETTAPPTEDMRRLLGRIERDQHLWLAVACKQIGKVARMTKDPLMDATIELFLKNASTIEAGLRCDKDLRLRVRFQANNDPSAKRIIETIKNRQQWMKLALAVTPKKEYEKRLWLRLLLAAKVERRGLWVEVNSQVTAAMAGA